MRVLFINSYPYLPQLFGGVETSTFQLCRQIEAAGHRTAVMSGINRSGWVWLRNSIARRLTRALFPRDTYRGMCVYRGYDHSAGFGEVIADFRPDAIVVSGGTDGTLPMAAKLLAQYAVPTFHYFHDIASVRRLSKPPNLTGLGFFANSRYTADEVEKLLGVHSTVLPPLVELDQYRTESSRAHVTMVNPRQIKGGATAVALARACPDIPFVILEAWDADEFVTSLREQARTLPNVSWRPGTRDMRAVYATTRIMLVPSEWEETWGRVVTEAHASGIPVLSSSVAALPETVGPGGLLVDKDAPIEQWVGALRTMWDDNQRYEQLCEAARRHSSRADVSADHLAKKFLEALNASSHPAVEAATTAG
jgi:glycosyltransferase involved in cell wall biosynthesis